MTRRLFFAAFAPGHGAPTDESRLDSFAQAYNVYVERLKAGIIDVKLWERVGQAWKRLGDQ